MKILQIIPFFTPRRGGSVVIPYNISKYLKSRNHDVTILTTDFELDNNYIDSIKKIGIKVIIFPSIISSNLFLFSPSMKKWLKKNISKFNVIHLHNYRTYQNIITSHYAKKNNIPYIIQSHGDIEIIIDKFILKKIYDFLWGNRILRNATRCISVSNVENKQYEYMNVDKERIVIIPNGLEINKFLKKNSINGKFRKKYDINEKNVILFLGRIHKIKGIDFLIKSFNLLRSEIDDIILLIVGQDDGYLIEMKKLVEKLNISKNVRFIDFISNVKEVFQDVDILVYPAIYEIFGLVPFESILCGTPVIVTRDSGCGQLIEKAKCGHLVQFGDTNDLKEKMLDLINNPNKGKKMVLNGQKFIEKNLSWNNVIKSVEKLYENCIYNR